MIIKITMKIKEPHGKELQNAMSVQRVDRFFGFFFLIVFEGNYIISKSCLSNKFSWENMEIMGLGKCLCI